jgi:hypothetical protein
MSDIVQPADVNDYVTQVQSLVANPSKRVLEGQELQEATKRYHCLPGWLAYARNINSLLPAAHRIYPKFESKTVSHVVRNWFVEYLLAGVLPESWTAIVVPFFIQAWKRTNTEPLLDETLIDFDIHKTGQDKRLLGSNYPSLRHLNKTIRREGGYERFLHGARRQFTHNNLKVARRLTYKCFRANPLCVGKTEWWKLLVKVHGGYRFTVKIQSICGSLNARRRQRHSSIALVQG